MDALIVNCKLLIAKSFQNFISLNINNFKS